LVDSRFANNTSRYTASALYADDVTGLSVIRCVFTEATTAFLLLSGI